MLAHVIIVLVIDIGERDSIFAKLLNYGFLLLFVVEVVVPGGLANEDVLTHEVVLKVVSLPQEVDLGAEIERHDASDAGAREGTVLRFQVVFHYRCDFCANCV